MSREDGSGPTMTPRWFLSPTVADEKHLPEQEAWMACRWHLKYLDTWRIHTLAVPKSNEEAAMCCSTERTRQLFKRRILFDSRRPVVVHRVSSWLAVFHSQETP